MMLPILISVSVTPGPYCFSASAGSAANAKAPGAAARIVRRVIRFILTSLRCVLFAWAPTLRPRRRVTHAGSDHHDRAFWCDLWHHGPTASIQVFEPAPP